MVTRMITIDILNWEHSGFWYKDQNGDMHFNQYEPSPEPSPGWITECREIALPQDAKWISDQFIAAMLARYDPDRHLGAVRD